MKKLWRKINVFFGFVDECEHEKELFCAGRIAFVKCLKCGFESMPWEVSQDKASAWKETNGYKLNKLYEFDKQRR